MSFPTEKERIFSTPSGKGHGVALQKPGEPKKRVGFSGGVCLTMVATWLSQEKKGASPRYFDQLGSLDLMLVTHAAYRIREGEVSEKAELPFKNLGLSKDLVTVIESKTELDEFLEDMDSFDKTANFNLRLDMSATGGGHTVGFTLRPGGGKYLDPNDGLFGFADRKRALEAIKAVFAGWWNTVEGLGGATFYVWDID